MICTAVAPEAVATVRIFGCMRRILPPGGVCLVRLFGRSPLSCAGHSVDVVARLGFEPSQERPRIVQKPTGKNQDNEARPQSSHHQAPRSSTRPLPRRNHPPGNIRERPRVAAMGKQNRTRCLARTLKCLLAK